MEKSVCYQMARAWTDSLSAAVEALSVCKEAKYVRGLGRLGWEPLTSP